MHHPRIFHSMDSRVQEELVATIVRTMAEAREGKEQAKIGLGSTNRIRGASGFEHQIDVSVQTQEDLFIWECKHWGRNVLPEAVLTLVARGFDIQRAHQERSVKLNIVVNRSLTAGAARLADFFGVKTHVATSPAEFALGYKTNRHIAVHDPLGLDDSTPSKG